MILVAGCVSGSPESQPSVLPVDRCERLWHCTMEKRRCCLYFYQLEKNHTIHIIVSFLYIVHINIHKDVQQIASKVKLWYPGVPLSIWKRIVICLASRC